MLAALTLMISDSTISDKLREEMLQDILDHAEMQSLYICWSTCMQNKIHNHIHILLPYKCIYILYL